MMEDRCEVCSARGCKLSHSENEIELSEFGYSKIGMSGTQQVRDEMCREGGLSRLEEDTP
jgi:hypothetical protein